MKTTENEPTHPEVASPYKILSHKKRVSEYLEGCSIFPVTLELDLTTECTRTCLDCPSTRARRYHHLSEDFTNRLFDLLEGQTRGLLLTGGEPTMAPHFPAVLKLARNKGFSEIAVVTNGSLLNKPDVVDALLSDASTIRLSMYDWEKGGCSELDKTFERIEALREKIERTGSPLHIGTSVLTSKNRLDRIEELSLSLYKAGAHWVYFHPMCKQWHLGSPTPVEQDGIFDRIDSLEKKHPQNFKIFTLPDRYKKFPLRFTEYHSSHFLLVVGADGKNYLGPEVKYQPQFVISDFSKGLTNEVLFHKSRLDSIRTVSSLNYSAIQSRHRSTLYNHIMEKLINQDSPVIAKFNTLSQDQFCYPFIL